MGSPFVSDLPFPGRPLQLPATRPAMLKIQDCLQQGGAQKKLLLTCLHRCQALREVLTKPSVQFERRSEKCV